MDDQLMIAAVAANRSLYDPSHSKYKDTDLRNAIWQKIAEDLGMEVEVCKAKWRTLRDGFTRALRQQKDYKIGQSLKVKKPWRYQNEMEFLIPFISPRESRMNAADRDGEDEESVLGRQAVSPTNCSTITSNDDIDDDDSTHSTVSTTITTTSAIKVEEPTLTPLIPGSFLNQKSNGVKRKLEASQAESFADYLKCRRMELDVLLKEQDLICAGERSCKCVKKEEDPVQTFFYSMGQSVRRLPFHLQAHVKMKVCQAVTEAELECLDKSSLP